jgi:hypothetical protein
MADASKRGPGVRLVDYIGSTPSGKERREEERRRKHGSRVK